MKSLVAALLLLVQAAPAPSPQTAKAAIEGLVVHVVTAAPIAGARVTLMRFVRVSNEFAGAEPVTTGQTDSQGRFRFQGLDPAVYVVQIEIDGYVALTERYLPPAGDQRSSRVAMVPIEGGRSVTDLLFRATPVNIIAGRIVDTAGRPLAGISVQAFRKTYDENGDEVFGLGGAATTNERGEYRLSVMPRAGYLVFARTGSATAAERYASSFHPGTIDSGAASTVDVSTGGATAILKDLALARQQLYAVRGRVVGLAAGPPPRDASVWITTTSLMGGETITAMPTYDPTTGTFETHVGPGRYAVGVTLLNPPPPVLTGSTVSVTLPPVARATFTISNGDVEGLVLRLVTPAVSLRGVLTADARTLSSLPGWEAVRVHLNTLRDEGGGQVLHQTLPAMPDGTFQLFGTMFGGFRLKVTGLPADAYVQAARLGGADVLTQPLRISESSTDTLEIALSSRGGRIDGTVLNDQRQPAARAQAVLVPDSRERIDLFAPATTDEAGRFTFRGVEPGAYRVFAWTAREPFAYFDLSILNRFANDATAVRVTEASRLDVAVRLISRQ